MRMRGRMGLTLPFLQRSPGGRDVATSTRKLLPWNCSFPPWSPLFIHWAERQVPILLQDHFSLKVCKRQEQDSYIFSISWALNRAEDKSRKSVLSCSYLHIVWSLKANPRCERIEPCPPTQVKTSLISVSSSTGQALMDCVTNIYYAEFDHCQLFGISQMRNFLWAQEWKFGETRTQRKTHKHTDTG